VILLQPRWHDYETPPEKRRNKEKGKRRANPVYYLCADHMNPHRLRVAVKEKRRKKESKRPDPCVAPTLHRPTHTAYSRDFPSQKRRKRNREGKARVPRPAIVGGLGYSHGFKRGGRERGKKERTARDLGIALQLLSLLGEKKRRKKGNLAPAITQLRL